MMALLRLIGCKIKRWKVLLRLIQLPDQQRQQLPNLEAKHVARMDRDAQIHFVLNHSVRRHSFPGVPLAPSQK